MSDNTKDSQDKKVNNTRNENIMEKVRLWQSFKYTKHLTCQRPGCGEDLVPKEYKGRVNLQCPKCHSVQSYVPKSVLKCRLETPSCLKNKNSSYSLDCLLDDKDGKD